MILRARKGVEGLEAPTEVEIKDKILLTIVEASKLSNIGTKQLYEWVRDERCVFVLRVKSKYLIKRKEFEKWLLNQYSV